MFSAFSPILYVKVSPERLTVRNVKTGAEFAEVPEVAIGNAGKKAVILAVGAAARVAAATSQAKLVNPVSHPRTLMGDFTIGQQLLNALLRRLDGSAWLTFAPRIVMHPLGTPEGDFTQVERRAFREMALGAGVSDVVLWVGRELSDQEVQSAEILSSRDGRE